MYKRKDAPNKRRILKCVMFEYESISNAPRSILSVPGFLQAEDKVQFEENAKAAERSKRYKAADSEGNIYLVSNAWAFMPSAAEGMSCGVQRLPKPEFVMSYEEACQMATNRKAEQKALALPAPAAQEDF